ncbi:C-X-C chemokine receptor type 3-like [Syngnathoides biaculeatus]|uniref:C-X-C chemokine receptor type 3-like n=1 Tax=Syngnathoides biaculeatus TaxID=300417 RepID=UPI002ADD572F|nr:C-X-C chemokine receptor type 3-like [Syngnathoides biaculeatus]XP_061674730.1 C-X-C chemokine receptor type 3-like [Syngnathoides biaculeatus]XP_061674731.1 C-X-C chemokine receptor type 3-like [Syngnathoides biaculeatus]XP_061674732.1 C-X-C chemokine receptor type 3-like [Syngnathoides biaculeatus]XP_061674733.1 C-X-C chemokine receptor type 3-like [Syngnathoides biaculeatus]XP_061674734.1 C-X-C chemokine receptor type 3-like [Syngnathoides biaculeatus]XP_061674735.1 C-X-C chemokine rece
MDVNLDGLFRFNDSYDYDDDYTYKDDDPESQSGEDVWIPLVYSAVLILGLFGNGLLLVTLALKKRAWRTSDTFMLHMSVADVLLLVTLPLWAAQATRSCGWCIGLTLCRISAVIFKVNFFCGIFLLAIICLDRYLWLVHAKQLYSHKKPTLVHLSCLSVWVIALLLTVPEWLFMALERHPWKEERTQCVLSLYPADKRLASRLPHHVLSAVAVIVIGFSCATPWLQRPAKTLRKRVVTLILVGVFSLCWIPYNIALVADTFSGAGNTSDGLSGLPQRTSLTVTAALGCIHACLRPLLYFALSGDFRKWTLAALSCVIAEPKGSVWELGVGDDASLEQSPETEELKQIASVEQQVQSKIST